MANLSRNQRNIEESLKKAGIEARVSFRFEKEANGVIEVVVDSNSRESEIYPIMESLGFVLVQERHPKWEPLPIFEIEEKKLV